MTTGPTPQTPARDELIAELLALPAAVGQAFHGASAHVEQRFGDEALFTGWLVTALDIARSSFRSWEATAEYVRSSPGVLDAMEHPQDARAWSESGRVLAGHSAALGVRLLSFKRVFP